MNNNNNKPEQEQKPIPSEGPLKNEPTPERAAEEKKRQEQQASGEKASLAQK